MIEPALIRFQAQMDELKDRLEFEKNLLDQNLTKLRKFRNEDFDTLEMRLLMEQT